MIAHAPAEFSVSQRPIARGVWLLESSVRVPRTVGEVFPFFSKAENLNALTPPWVNFRILTPLPIDMRPGAVIDYRIRVRGIPMRWRTVITAFEPPHRFVDEQVRGPYGLWHHTHEFEPAPDSDGGGTICRDRVRYALKPGFIAKTPLAAMLQRALVGPDCQKIFEFRARKMLELFS